MPSRCNCAWGSARKPASRKRVVSALDVNNDGYPDLLLQNLSYDRSEKTRIYLNLHDPSSSDPKDRIFVDFTDSTGAYDLDAYADEHALGEQRYFNLQCLIYGTDPEGFAGMVQTGDLTAARAAGCERETRQASRAWVRLLAPYLAPGHEAYRDEAVRYLERAG